MAARGLALADRFHQALAFVVAAERKIFPPERQPGIDLARIGTQAQEVEASPKPRLLDQG